MGNDSVRTDRREFMRNLGVALASLLAARCSGGPTCYVPLPLSPTPTGGDEWNRLRQPWEDLDLLARKI